MKKRNLIVILVLCVPFLIAAGSKVGVIEIQPTPGLDAEKAHALTESIQIALFVSGKFDVIFLDRFPKIINNGRFQDGHMCQDLVCICKIGRCLGASKMMHCIVSRDVNSWYLKLEMVDVINAKIENVLQKKYPLTLTKLGEELFSLTSLLIKSSPISEYHPDFAKDYLFRKELQENLKYDPFQIRFRPSLELRSKFYLSFAKKYDIFFEPGDDQQYMKVMDYPGTKWYQAHIRYKRTVNLVNSRNQTVWYDYELQPFEKTAYCFDPLPHPPAFHDLRPYFEEINFCKDQCLELDKYVRKALQITRDEIQILKTSRNPDFLVGCVLLAPGDDFYKSELLEQASQLEDPPGFATLALIEHYITLLICGKDDPQLERSALDAFTRLMRADKHNAYLHYLLAIWKQKYLGNAEAITEINRGNKKGHFDSYRKQSFQMIHETALKLGYPNFTAHYLAFDKAVFPRTYNALIILCDKVVESDEKENACDACLKMGKTLARHSEHYIQYLMAYHIQIKSLQSSNILDNEKLKDDANKQWREKETIQKQAMYHLREIILKSWETPHTRLTEEFWLKINRYFFEKGWEQGYNYILSLPINDHIKPIDITPGSSK